MILALIGAGMSEAVKESNKSFEREMQKAQKDVDRQMAQIGQQMQRDMEQAERQTDAQMALIDRSVRSSSNAPAANSQSFDYKNVTVKSDYGLTRVIGEVTNKSGRSYAAAIFVVTLYSTDGKLLDTGNAAVSNLGNGDTKSFEAPFVGVPHDKIDKYKIQFESGF